MINIRVRKTEDGELSVETEAYFVGSFKEIETIQYAIIKSLKEMAKEPFQEAMIRFIMEELKDEQSENLRK